MRLNTHIIIRILTVILLLTGVSGGGNLVYAWSGGSGTSSDPYLIGSKADWDFFIQKLSNYNQFVGNFLKLTADIDIGDKITPAGRDFYGTFDGDGHTLKVNCSGTGQFIALFRGTYGATIKNLKVVGSIHNTATSSGNINHENKFTAGLVGHCQAGTVIQNCVISVTITSDISGDGSHGGIVGWINNASSEANRVRIENCLFNGKLLGENTYNCGGFVGAGAPNATQYCSIDNCLFSPSEITMSTSGSATFSRCSNTTITNSCYTKVFSTITSTTTQDQGTDKSGATASDIVSFLNGNSNPGLWVATNGGKLPYLNSFVVPVKITGWIAGVSGPSDTNPSMDILGGSGMKYAYKKTDLSDEYYTETAPTTAGHYHVRATSPDGFQNMADFYIYDPPTPISPLTFNYDVQTLATFQNTPGGYFNFRIPHADWTPRNAPVMYQAGTFTVQYIVLGESGYNNIGNSNPWESAGSFTVTIDPKPLGSETISLEQTTYTYDGTAKTPEVTVKDGDRDPIESDRYTVSYSNNINAGTATVTVTAIPGKNLAVNGTKTFTINPKTVSNPTITLSETSYDYDGNSKTPTVTVKDGSNEIPSSEYSVFYSNNTNAGTATVTVTNKDGGNYVVSGTKTFTINRKTVSNPTITLSETSYVYDDNPKMPSVTVKDGNNVIPPSEYSVSYSNNKNAGTATVTITDNPDGNYTVNGSTTFSITKEQLVVTVTANDLYYNYEEQNLVTGSLSGSGSLNGCQILYSLDNVTSSTNVPKGKEAKTYTVYYHVLADGNHMSQPVKTINVTIKGKKVDTPTIQIGPSTFTYDRNPKTPDVTVYDGNYLISSSEYTVSYSNNTNAGTNATVTVTDKEGGNYVVNGTKTFTINPKEVFDPTITLSKTSYVYDGNPKTPDVTTVKDGSDVIPTSEYSVSYSENTNAGIAIVTVADSNADGGNYTIRTKSETFTIEKEQLEVTVTANDLYYNYEEQELVTGSITGSGTYNPIQYSLDNVTYTTSVPKGKKTKTYTVYYKVAGDDNHKGQDVKSINVTIKGKKVDNPKIEISPSVCTYDGKPKTPDVRVYDGTTEILSSEFTVSYSNNTNVGTAKVTIKDVEGGTYTVSGTATFYIQEAGSSYIPPIAKTGLAYTGKAQELVTPGSTTTGTMHYYSLDGKSYSTDIPTGIDAKTYTVYYKVVGDDNHEDSPAVELSVTISSKDVTNPTITLSQSSYFYDGTAKKPSVTVKDGDTTIDSKEYTVSYSNNTNIGSATVTIKDKEGGNYIVSGKTTFSILDPKSGFTPPSAISGLEYNGSAQKLIEAGSAPDDCKIVYSLDGKNYSAEIPTGTDAKTYTIYAKLVDKDNKDRPNTEVYTLTVTINRKSVFISVTLTDAGPQKIPVITVTDLDGNKLGTNAFSVIFTNAEGQNVEPDKGKIAAGTYTVTVSLTGNYTGPSVAKGILILKDYSFAFTMESDLITICLPYDREKPAGYDVYRLNSIDNTGFPVFKRLNTTTLSAGQPYLFKYTGSSTRGSRTLDLSPSDSKSIDTSTKLESQTAGNLIFVGTFQDMSNEYATKNGSYILQTDGTWKVPEYANNKICLEAFHAYLHYRNRSVHVSPMTMTLTDSGKVDPEPEPAAIDGVILEEEDGSRAWYDLQGRRLDGPQKGVNILRTKDGKTKKVVKK